MGEKQNGAAKIFKPMYDYYYYVSHDLNLMQPKASNVLEM